MKTTPATVASAVRTCAVPCHADEQGPVVAEVLRLPVLRVGHHLPQILLHSRQVEFLNSRA
jgi:hypothetical protein